MHSIFYKQYLFDFLHFITPPPPSPSNFVFDAQPPHFWGSFPFRAWNAHAVRSPSPSPPERWPPLSHTACLRHYKCQVYGISMEMSGLWISITKYMINNIELIFYSIPPIHTQRVEKFIKQKKETKINSVGRNHTRTDNKTNKAQAGRFRSTVSHNSSVRERGRLWNKNNKRMK